MKGENKQPRASIKREIARTKFTFEGRNATNHMRFRAVRDADTGETQIHVTIPHAEWIVFEHDLGALLRSFGWGMAALGRDLEAIKGGDPAVPWHQSCLVITMLEYALRLDEVD